MSDQLFDTAPFHDPEAAKKLLGVFLVDDDSATAHVITDSPEKAIEIAGEVLCYMGDEPPVVKELPVDTVLQIWMENGRISDSGELVHRTCAEWIASQGEGLLCCSDF